MRLSRDSFAVITSGVLPINFVIGLVIGSVIGSVIGGCTDSNPEYVATGDGEAPLVADGDVTGAFLDASQPAPDLSAPPPFIPSHVSPSYFNAGTADLVINSAIDTAALTIDGQPAPNGVVFIMDQGFAVLAAHSVSIPAGKMVRASGAKALIVVTGATITVDGLLDGEGHLDSPGPGGAGPALGAGGGPAGAGSGLDSGGGGAGYHDGGGHSGSVGGIFCGNPDQPEVPGGMSYGDPMLTMLLAGSGGGNGHLGGMGCAAGKNANGGSGGGAIQLSAGTSLRLSGKINVGGGGGHGGCVNPKQSDTGSGGGGGSGGALLLESVAIDATGGTVAANGGGGGGGSFDTEGGVGADGQASAAAAAGGSGGKRNGLFNSQELTDQQGGPGGTSGAGGNAPDAKSSCGNSGGGGGAAGRVYLRSRAAPVMMGAVISPGAVVGTL